jgi:hypothetical protein
VRRCTISLIIHERFTRVALILLSWSSADSLVSHKTTMQTVLGPVETLIPQLLLLLNCSTRTHPSGASLSSEHRYRYSHIRGEVTTDSTEVFILFGSIGFNLVYFASTDRD